MVGKTKTTSKASPEVESKTRKRSPGRPKSPARTKSPGRKSPARTSPARTKPETTKTAPETPTRSSTRTRSPARLRNASPTTSTPRSTPVLTPSRRSPIRRSPARLVKESSEDKERDIPILRTRKQKIIIDTDTDSDNAESIPEKIEKPKALVRGRSRRKDVEMEPDEKGDRKLLDLEGPDPIGLVHRFTRSSQNRELERVVHLKHFDSVTVTKRLGEFSDEDDVLLKKSETELQEFSNTKKLTEFGGSYGASILIVTLPIFTVATNVLCNEEQCSFSKLPDLQKYKSFAAFFNAKAYLGFVAYLTIIAILSAVPFGSHKIPALPNKHGKFYYIMNGLFSFFVTLLIGCGLEIGGISVANFILDHILPLCVASVLCGVVVSVYVYVRSFYVPVSALNAHVVGKSGVYGFFIGREINPRIFSILDLKMLFLRSCMFGVMLIDFAYLYDSLDISSAIKESGNEKTFDPKLLHVQPTLLVYVLLHTIFCMDVLIFESSLVTSFEIQQEALGYMAIMGYLIYPFLTSLIPKYIVNYGVELASWKLALISIVFCLGYILYRGSNNQKDAFRKNPYSPALSHLETIPTTQGKKLLVSGFWGFVRHPNYLGDIVIHCCFLPFTWCAPPILYPVTVALMLVHRSVRDNARCKLKYGAAWDRYCNRVKHVLIPKVY